MEIITLVWYSFLYGLEDWVLSLFGTLLVQIRLFIIVLLVKALFHVYCQLLDDIYKQNLLHYITATSVDQWIDLIIDFSLLDYRARWIDINRNGTPIDNIIESEYKYHVTLSRSLFHILV